MSAPLYWVGGTSSWPFSAARRQKQWVAVDHFPRDRRIQISVRALLQVNQGRRGRVQGTRIADGDFVIDRTAALRVKPLDQMKILLDPQ